MQHVYSWPLVVLFSWLGLVWLGVEIMPFRWVLASRAMIPSWGKGATPPIIYYLFFILTDNCCKLIWFPKKITLAFLKVVIPQFPYWVLKIQYICSFPFSKRAIDWDFIPEVKPKACKWMSIKHVMNLEVKTVKKSSSTLRL